MSGLVKAGSIEQLAQLLLDTVSADDALDLSAGSVSPLFKLYGAYSSWRARTFLNHLTSPDPQKAGEAEKHILALAQTTRGERILRHAVHDVLFGTETVSLAALAILAAEASQAPSTFQGNAARALDGAATDDLAVFLTVMSYPGNFSGLGKRAQQLMRFAEVLPLSGWKNLETLTNGDEDRFIGAIVELGRRGILVPDYGAGRTGGDGRWLYVTPSKASFKFYELIHRAFHMAEPHLLSSLAPLSASAVINLWSSKWPELV